MKKVMILMSTYNGQNYLEEQLDSLISQTYSEIEIYIRDDGSSDETTEILKRYCQNHANINVDFGDNVGYPECFYKLTDKKLDGDYFMFADQDDQWLPFKVERAVKFLNSESSNGPVCYYSSYNICDSNLKFVHESPNKDKKFTLKDTLFEVCGLEFTMAMNRQAFELLNIYRPIISNARGTWMSMLFSSKGKVLFDNIATANYRRHENAVTSPNMGSFGLFLWRVKKFLLSENSNNYKNMLREFRDIMGDNLNTQEKEMLSIFCDDHGFIGSIKKIFYPQRLRSSILDDFQLRVLFLLKKI